MATPRRILKSLLLVEERLLEADYFVNLMRKKVAGGPFGYCLNAFLSAARSVSFLIQKEMSQVPEFDIWWNEQQELLRIDPSARFFLKMRNFSQKEGRISLVGSRNSQGRWTHRFAGTPEKVPTQLLKRDVADCCAEHIGKLARLVLACTERFPYYSCPRRACTPEGLEALGLRIEDLVTALGMPPEWIQAAGNIPFADQLRILSRNIDGLDFETITKLAQRPISISPAKTPDDVLGQEWVDLVVDQLEKNGAVDHKFVLGTMILGQRLGSADQSDPPASEGSRNL